MIPYVRALDDTCQYPADETFDARWKILGDKAGQTCAAMAVAGRDVQFPVKDPQGKRRPIDPADSLNTFAGSGTGFVSYHCMYRGNRPAIIVWVWSALVVHPICPSE